MKRIIILWAMLSLLFLSGCDHIGSRDKVEHTIVIAGKPMTEQYILVEILAQLIEGQTNLNVVRKPGIGGGTSNIHPAMIKGEIDIYPEYTGTSWLFVLKEDPLNDPLKLYNEVKAAYQETFNIQWSGLYGFNDTFAIAIKRDVSERFDIKTYTDLARHSRDIKFGAEYDFYERDDGYPGLVNVYGFDFKHKTELDIGLKYQAIISNQVDAINVFSTDARLNEADLIVLEDDKNFFPSYYAASLIRSETLVKYPELEEILELLTNRISTEEMTAMNYQVEIEKKSPKDVATEFIQEKGLLNGIH